MRVFFVGAGPGDRELLTIKAHRLLTTCRICIYAGSLLNPDVLELIPESAEKHDSARLDLDGIADLFREARDRDIDVVRLHSGDPSLYGAISEQMGRLDSLGIDYEVVPGVSSFQAAAAALKTELTAPEIAQTVILTRMPGRTPFPEAQSLERLAQSKSTLCIFLSVDKVAQAVREIEAYYGRDCPAAVVCRAAWPDQVVVRGALEDIAEKTRAAGVTRTAVIIVGHALARPTAESKLYDPAFSHGYREGKP
ncbi:MAG: precorrin-4 C(11)-methyltransferase [Deltaproteobacteria bacterium]|nr:precorrin-4 C(11)-methyltransferase [Deltaproteobacteria bacterium]